MVRELPPFKTLTHTELRTLWTQHQNEDVRRLILEVVRYRSVIKEVEGLYKSTHQAWRDQVGGNLVALHLLQQIMNTELQRMQW